ncbi:MAG: ectonucleotide pyrophosphatase/phosphodiesterase [Terriglobia bacterium]
MLRHLFAALAFSATLAAQSNHKLLVISIDGLDARFLNDPALKVKAPNIRRLMRNGASATVVGVAPSETWPSHASLVTGVSPWQNGITANKAAETPGDRFFSSAAFKTLTLWDAVTAAGMKSASIYWPVTLGAKEAFDFPEYWEARTGNAVALDPIAQKSTPAGLADRVEKVFPSFEKQLWDDSSSASAATYLLSVEKPDLLLVHMAEVDAEQHDTGALSIYAREILENDDEMIGQMLEKMPANAIVAVLSDHGFENSNYKVRPKVLLKQAGIKGKVEVADGLIGTSDAAVAAHLRRLIGQGKKSGIAREVPMAQVKARVPALGRWTAAFDTLQNFVASDEDHGPAVGPGTHLGVHGLWPERPNYRSIFILSGPGVRAVKLGEIDMLQIAPTLAEIVGVKLPAAKSASLWHSVTR